MGVTPEGASVKQCLWWPDLPGMWKEGSHESSGPGTLHCWAMFLHRVVKVVTAERKLCGFPENACDSHNPPMLIYTWKSPGHGFPEDACDSHNPPLLNLHMEEPRPWRGDGGVNLLDGQTDEQIGV